LTVDSLNLSSIRSSAHRIPSKHLDRRRCDRRGQSWS
jgi:hypothetical protein